MHNSFISRISKKQIERIAGCRARSSQGALLCFTPSALSYCENKLRKILHDSVISRSSKKTKKRELAAAGLDLPREPCSVSLLAPYHIVKTSYEKSGKIQSSQGARKNNTRELPAAGLDLPREPCFVSLLEPYHIVKTSYEKSFIIQSFQRAQKTIRGNCRLQSSTFPGSPALSHS